MFRAKSGCKDLRPTCLRAFRPGSVLSISGLFLFVLIMAGCHAPRIDVYEFIRLHEKMEAERDGGSGTVNEPKRFLHDTDAPQTQDGHVALVNGQKSLATGTRGDANKGEGLGDDNGFRWDPVQKKWRSGPVEDKTTPRHTEMRVTTGNGALLLASHEEPPPSDATIDAGLDISSVLAQMQTPFVTGPLDVLKVSITGLTGPENLTEPTAVLTRIDRNGEIHLPLVGAVKVGGLPLEDVERAIRTAYIPKFVPTLAVSVEIEEYASTDVIVVGAAEIPGIVRLPRTKRNVLHAVAAAGGMTKEASGHITFQRMRDSKERISLYLRNSHDLKSVLALDDLESGDVITVEAEQANLVFVGGLVNAPGPKQFPPGTRLTALQALAAGGGIIEAVFPTEATLIRRMPNGEDVHVRIDLDRTRRGEDPNVMLAAGDIFWVPETFGTRVMDFIDRTVQFRAGATVTYNVTGIEFLNRHALQSQRAGGGTTRDAVDPIGFLFP